jgi:hypothetical protein
MPRITKNEALRILESARFYLAKLPVEDQFFMVDPVTNMLTNPAIPLLFHVEQTLRYWS